MSWSHIQTLYDGQGLLFWAAAVAVALGLTLLSVSIVFQLRKVFGQRCRPGGRKTGNKRSLIAQATAKPTVTAAPEGYRPQGIVPLAPAADGAVERNEPLLGDLLDRLKTSADRLERMHRTLGNEAEARPGRMESPLKEPVEDVDYVYQAARA